MFENDINKAETLSLAHPDYASAQYFLYGYYRDQYHKELHANALPDVVLAAHYFKRSHVHLLNAALRDPQLISKHGLKNAFTKEGKIKPDDIEKVVDDEISSSLFVYLKRNENKNQYLEKCAEIHQILFEIYYFSRRSYVAYTSFKSRTLDIRSAFYHLQRSHFLYRTNKNEHLFYYFELHGKCLQETVVHLAFALELLDEESLPFDTLRYSLSTAFNFREFRCAAYLYRNIGKKEQAVQLSEVYRQIFQGSPKTQRFQQLLNTLQLKSRDVSNAVTETLHRVEQSSQKERNTVVKEKNRRIKKVRKSFQQCYMVALKATELHPGVVIECRDSVTGETPVFIKKEDKTLIVNGDGSDVFLSVEGELEINAVIIFNPRARFLLSLRAKSVDNFIVNAEVRELIWKRGYIESEENISLHVSQELLLEHECTLRAKGEAQLVGKEVYSHGKVESQGKCRVIFEKEVNFLVGSSFSVGALECQTQLLKFNSEMDVQGDVFIHAQAGSDFQRGSFLKAKGKLQIKTHHLFAHATSVFTSGGMLEIQATGKVTCQEKTTWITQNKMIVRASQWNNAGNLFSAEESCVITEEGINNEANSRIESNQSIVLCGKNITNRGELLAKENVSIDADHLLYNTGAIKASNIATVSGVVVNTGFGRISAINSGSMSCLIKINTALIDITFSYQNALVPIELGIEVPCLRFSDMFSKLRSMNGEKLKSYLCSMNGVSNLVMAAAQTVKLFCVPARPFVNLGLSAFAALRGLYNLGTQSSTIYAKYKSESLRTSDAIRLVASLGSLAAPSLQSLSFGESLGKNFTLDVSHASSPTPSDVLAVLGPMHIDNALFRAEIFGGTLSPNLIQRSVASCQGLQVKSGYDVSDSSLYSLSNGVIVAETMSLEGYSAQWGGKKIAHILHGNFLGEMKLEEGTLLEINEGSLGARRLDQVGDIRLNHASLDVKETHHIEKNAVFDMTHSQVHNGKTHIEGRLDSSQSSWMTEAEIKMEGSVNSHESSFSTKGEMDVGGQLTSEHSSFVSSQAIHIEAGANLHTDDTVIQGNSIYNAGQTQATGYLGFTASTTIEMKPTAIVNNPQGEVHYKAQSGEINAQTQAAKVEIDIESLGNEQIEKFLNEGSTVRPTESLTIKSGQTAAINHATHLPFSLHLVASGVDVNQSVHSDHSVFIETTQGDIQIHAPMEAKEELELKSHTNLQVTNTSLRAGHLLNVEAAHAITNEMGQWSAQEVKVTSHHGSIINHAGIMKASEYLDAAAPEGRVSNTAAESLTDQLSSQRQEVTPGIIRGGDGKNHGGVGLHISAGEKVVNYISRIESAADNVIEGNHGVENIGAVHTYVVRETHNHSWWGDNDTLETDTQLFRATILSELGRNYISTSQGEIYSLGSQFISNLGNSLYAPEGGVKLYDIVAARHVYEYDSSCFGLLHSETEVTHQFIEPTLLLDQNPSANTTIYSGQTVDMRGAYLITPGKAVIEGNDIRLSQSILSHDFFQSSTGFTCELPFESLNDWQMPHHAMDWVDTMGSQFLNAGNFGIRFASTKMQSHDHTLGSGGIVAGNLSMYVKESLQFLNGASVEVTGDFDASAKHCLQSAAALTSTVDKEEDALTADMSLGGAVLAMSHTHTELENTNVINQQIHVSGKTNVHFDDWIQNGGTLTTPDISGEVGEYTRITRQNTSSLQSTGFQLSTTGHVAYQHDMHLSATNQAVNELQGSAFIVHHANIIDARETSEEETISVSVPTIDPRLLESIEENIESLMPSQPPSPHEAHARQTRLERWQPSSSSPQTWHERHATRSVSPSHATPKSHSPTTLELLTQERDAAIVLAQPDHYLETTRSLANENKTESDWQNFHHEKGFKRLLAAGELVLDYPLVDTAAAITGYKAVKSAATLIDLFSWRNTLTPPRSPTPLSRGGLEDYIHDAPELTREEIAEDAIRIGLRNKGEEHDVPFLHFVDRHDQTRLKIHPSDAKTPYEHMHIYNRKGESLDANLRPVKRQSPEAHIPIKPSGNTPSSKLH